MWLPKSPFPPVIKYDSGIACKSLGGALRLDFVKLLSKSEA